MSELIALQIARRIREDRAMTQVTTPKPPKAPKPEKSALVRASILLFILALASLTVAAFVGSAYLAVGALLWGSGSITAAVLSLRE